MAYETASVPAVVLKIKKLMPSLSKSEQLVAQFIVDHPDEVITLSVAALADAVNVSDPTVVRACRRLGYVGYQDLKVTLAQSIATPLQNIHEKISADDDIQKITDKVFVSAIQTLEFTHNTLSSADIQEAAEALMQARRITIFGVGASGATAEDLNHKLLRLGLNSSAYSDEHLQAISTAYCSSDDIIFAISHSGSSRSVVDNVRMAKENGAKIIVLTSLGSSPLSKLADICLYTASTETKYRILALSSRIAELTIIDTIYTYIAMRSDSVKHMKVEEAMKRLKY